MYLGIVSIVTRRKNSKCSNGGCTLGDLLAGELAMTVVRKSRKGRSYRNFHFPCFLNWAIHMYERRKKFLAEHPPVRTGRPAGSVVQQFAKDYPELAAERQKCIRDRARLMRHIQATADMEKQAKWIGRIKSLDKRIREILPLQVEEPGRRSEESREKLRRMLG